MPGGRGPMLDGRSGPRLSTGCQGHAVSPCQGRPARCQGRSFRTLHRPGEVVHSLDGRRIAFESATGTFLQRSWGYVASWYSRVESALARGSPCGHPPPQKPAHSLRVTFWARGESPRRLAVYGRCGAPVFV